MNWGILMLVIYMMVAAAVVLGFLYFFFFIEEDKPEPADPDRLLEAEFALDDVYEEVEKAMSKYPPFNSAHEGYSVLAEEVDELWEEVKVKQGNRDVDKLYAEAKQVAAMAVRFMVDIANEKGGQK